MENFKIDILCINDSIIHVDSLGVPHIDDDDKVWTFM